MQNINQKKNTPMLLFIHYFQHLKKTGYNKLYSHFYKDFIMDMMTITFIVLAFSFFGLFIWYWGCDEQQEKTQTQGNPYIQSVFQPQSDAGRFHCEQRQRAYSYASRHVREDNLGQIVAAVVIADMMIDTSNSNSIADTGQNNSGTY
jgi:hypothetical protein